MAKNHDMRQGIDDLVQQRVISEKLKNQFAPSGNQTVEVPNSDDIKGDPVFLCVLVDASGSMNACKDAVVKSHPIMLDALRGSAHARKDLLYISQYLFNSSSKKLHSYKSLSTTGGSDGVTVLDPTNYSPSGNTALYRTLHSSLQDMLVTLSYARQEGFAPCCSISLITDGADTEGGVDPSVIRDLFQELREKKILKSSVLVGLLNSNLTKDRLETIQKTLGFQNLIDCGQNSEKEIRNSFTMASQSMVAGLR